MRFRPDIEGLRAVCILLVVAYHYYPAELPGGYVGVDIFFVISGFLITHSLLEQSDPAVPFRSWLVSFWSRRARRLLPNALLVLVVASAIGLAWLSDFSVKKLGSDVFWSATYSVNWLYILRAADYLQWDESRNSVLLNFWSLAIEEQYYLLWPAVLFATLKVSGHHAKRLPTFVTRATVALLFALSFVYCVWLASTQLTSAFFATPSRAWELLAGAWLAVNRRHAAEDVLHARRPAALAPAIGVASIVSCALLFSDETIHPGPLTLIPVLAAMAVIRYGGACGEPVQRILGSRPMTYFGSRSYSIYLWHWPVLVLGKHIPLPSAAVAPVLLGLSWLLAEAAYRWVETPARFEWARGLSARRTVAIAAISSGLVAVVGLGLRAAGANSAREMLTLRPALTVAARGLPQLHQLSKDLPAVYPSGCHLALDKLENAECLYGDELGSGSAVLFGDSHAAQWFPAVDAAARQRGIRLHSWTKSSCPSADVSIWNQVAKGAYTQCDAWREHVFARIEQLRPRVVILSNLVDETTVLVDRSTGKPMRGREASAEFSEGVARVIARLRRSGAAVVVIRDTPRPRPDILDCLYSATAPESCELKRAEATNFPPLDISAARRAGAIVWDLTDQICAGNRCPVVVQQGTQPVYRDSNHLTASFVATLSGDVVRRWSELPVGAAGTGR